MVLRAQQLVRVFVIRREDTTGVVPPRLTRRYAFANPHALVKVRIDVF